MTQSLDVGRLQRALASSPVQWEPRLYAQVNSTQDLVTAAAEAGAAQGLVVIADEQLSGRGRSGRQWIAPPGSSLMFSVLLRPQVGVECSTSLSLVAGLALVEGLALAGGPRTELKWPNDCLCGDRKLAGVLAESATMSGGELVVILGIGCNVSWAQAQIPAELRQTGTACDLEGHPLDRTDLAEAVLRRLAIRYMEWTSGGFSALRDAWIGHAAWIGQEVIAQTPSGVVQGIARGVSEVGDLIVETTHGPLAIVAGELRRPGGPQLRLARRLVS